MINLHKLNGQEFVLNAEMIETVESVPDTLICLTNGNKYLVAEKPELVSELVASYRARLLKA